MATTLTVTVGAVIGWAWERSADRKARPASARQLGVLLASGMIVGEGLLGVGMAALAVFSGKDAPLALVAPDFADTAVLLGGVGFIAAIGALYRWLGKMSDGVGA